MTEGPLSRWSRRKRGLAPDAAPAVAEAPDAPAGRPEPDESGPDESEAAFLERTGLPDPDTLGPEADLEAYLKRTVPEALRRRAMRLLWRRNPVLANLDGLVDYGGDFTDAATVPKFVATAYTVGRGFRAAVERITGDPEEDAAASIRCVAEGEVADAETDAEVPALPPGDENLGSPTGEAPAAVGAVLAADAGPPAQPVPADPPPRSRTERMKFRLAK